MTENLRHHYAAAALSGLIAREQRCPTIRRESLCATALFIADAMLSTLTPLPENDPLGRDADGVSSGMRAWLEADKRKMQRKPENRYARG